MFYKTSQQLIDILLKFGFVDVTKVYFPIYWNLIEGNKTHDPSTIRIFEFKELVILFDASHIRVSVAKENIYKTDFLTTEELQSILYYIVYPQEYLKLASLILNPVYLLPYLYKEVEQNKNLSEIDKESYFNIINTVLEIKLI